MESKKPDWFDLDKYAGQQELNGQDWAIQLAARTRFYGEQDIPFTLVEFSRLFMTSRESLQEFAKSKDSRPRLNPPYREHLSQAFARYFMRVGLPSDIPSF